MSSALPRRYKCLQLYPTGTRVFSFTPQVHMSSALPTGTHVFSFTPQVHMSSALPTGTNVFSFTAPCTCVFSLTPHIHMCLQVWGRRAGPPSAPSRARPVSPSRAAMTPTACCSLPPPLWLSPLLRGPAPSPCRWIASLAPLVSRMSLASLVSMATLALLVSGTNLAPLVSGTNLAYW